MVAYLTHIYTLTTAARHLIPSLNCLYFVVSGQNGENTGTAPRGGLAFGGNRAYKLG
jgi:hypothetical protein